jgi:hypothetical protein
MSSSRRAKRSHLCSGYPVPQTAGRSCNPAAPNPAATTCIATDAQEHAALPMNQTNPAHA